MRVMVCDDEPLARQRLIRLLDNLPGYDVAGEVANGQALLDAVQHDRPDIILLDIRMPGLDGLQAAKKLCQLGNPPAIIFCTAYDQHALEAFKVQALDYLLKPIGRDALQEALQRASRLAAAQQEENKAREYISARTHKGLELVPLAEVRYFRAEQKYVVVRSAETEVLIDTSLKELESEFADTFFRIHRNALIAIGYLEGLETEEGGQHLVRLAGIDERLVVSRRHLAPLRKLMQTL